MLMVPLQIESLGMEDEIQCITSFSTSESHHGHALGISLPSQFFWLCLLAGFCFISLNDFIIYLLITILPCFPALFP